MPEILSDNGHPFGCNLDSLNVFSLPAFRALSHIELHRLSFLQTAKPASLNCGEMHEYILSRLTADKTIAFGVVKPLYCSLFQLIFLFSILEFRLRRVAAVGRGTLVGDTDFQLRVVKLS